MNHDELVKALDEAIACFGLHLADVAHPGPNNGVAHSPGIHSIAGRVRLTSAPNLANYMKSKEPAPVAEPEPQDERPIIDLIEAFRASLAAAKQAEAQKRKERRKRNK